MRLLVVIICLVATHSFLKCQIGIQTNLPKSVALNSEVTFNVKIKKGSTANFAKYQMDVPREVAVKEGDSKSGSFTFEENSVKIIWVMAPQEPEIIISFKLMTGVIPGKKTLVQKYFYIENDDKKQIEMEPLTFLVKDSSSTEPFVSPAEYTEVAPKALPSLLTTTINAAEIGTKNPALLIQQVLQLKKDSRDAYAVGEKEKKKGEQKLAEANDAMAKAEAVTDENEKKIAVEKATELKLKAENDIQVADRVLVLAKSLEDNADEIDAINRTVNPDSYSTDPKIAVANKKNVAATGSAPETSKTLNMDEPEVLNTDKKKSKDREKDKERDKEAEKGLVYKIQLGAFSKEPSKRDFKAIGKVKISEENGMFKVLYGSYSFKEDAFKQREQIIAKGFDGFVVAYEDGVRVFK